jgi:hypothetical protein
MIKELQKEIYDNAVQKGLYDIEPAQTDFLNDFHAELTEAWIEHKKGLYQTYYVDQKPCGFWIEVADFVIYILSYCEHKGFEPPVYPPIPHRTGLIVCSVSEFISHLHNCELYSIDIYNAVNFCFDYARMHNLDLEVVIKEKMNYNKKRSYKRRTK